MLKKYAEKVGYIYFFSYLRSEIQHREHRIAKKDVGRIHLKQTIMRSWTVRAKKTINPGRGIVEGVTFNVVTPFDLHDYSLLEKAIADAGHGTCVIGGCANDAYWDWY